jgi:hypothetical protein
MRRMRYHDNSTRNPGPLIGTVNIGKSMSRNSVSSGPKVVRLGLWHADGSGFPIWRLAVLPSRASAFSLTSRN